MLLLKTLHRKVTSGMPQFPSMTSAADIVLVFSALTSSRYR